MDPMILNVNLTPRQWEAWRALRDSEVKDVMYGGAKGGGKSWFLCVWVYSYALEVASRFDLPKTDKPPHIGWMGRKIGADFVATTLQTWQDIIPPDAYRICSATDRHPKHILIDNRVAVDFGGLDRREDINKFNSAEYGFLAVDQAEETTKDNVSVLMASRRLRINNQPLPYKGLWTANPAQCWLRPYFIDTQTPGTRFVQALPSDNPYLPPDYVATLTEAFGHRPEVLEAYLNGSWDEMEGAGTIIRSRWLREAKRLSRIGEETVRHLIAVDPARYGDDEFVAYYFHNTRIEDELVAGSCSTTEGASRVAELAERHRLYDQRPVIICDEDGVGGGVIDQLRSWGFEVLGIQSASKANNPDRYYNRRAEMWWEVGQKYSRGDIHEGVTTSERETGVKPHCDDELDRQMSSVQYEWRNGKILAQPKKTIKETLGRSPDRADAKVMGLYMLAYIEPVTRTLHWDQAVAGDEQMANSYAIPELME